MLLELGHHVMDQAGGNGEADAHAAARGREDHRIHADHLPAQVEGGAARIAAIDGRVDLDEVGVLLIAVEARPAQRRDDARRHRVGQAERIAHRHDPVADAQALVVAELDAGQRRLAFDLEQRHVGRRICADHLGGEAAPVGQLDGDLLAGIHHMVVGDDITGLVDDEARPGAEGAVRLGLGPQARPAELIEQVAELLRDLAVGVVAVGGGGLAGDGHHRGADALHQIGEGKGRAVFQHARRGGTGGGIVLRHHHRPGDLDVLDGRQEAEGAQAHHHDGGGGAQRDHAALAAAGAGKFLRKLGEQGAEIRFVLHGRLLGAEPCAALP